MSSVNNFKTVVRCTEQAVVLS